eukprot:15452826-Alexandrium_andersonii.AAC.1
MERAGSMVAVDVTVTDLARRAGGGQRVAPRAGARGAREARALPRAQARALRARRAGRLGARG